MGDTVHTMRISQHPILSRVWAYDLNIAPSYKGRRLKISYVHQSGVKPPKFTFHVNDKTLVHFSYERYLENKIREAFSFIGTPIILEFKNKNDLL